MRTLTNKLLPFAASGLYLRTEAGDTLYISGFRGDVDLDALEQEIRAGWLDIARQEAMLRVRAGAEARAQALRPPDFADLMARLQLGRIRPEDQARLNAYYDALDALDAEREQLEATIATASVAILNAMEWPEWVGWEALPLRLKLEVEQTYPEASNK